jgi:hypothetical protein
VIKKKKHEASKGSLRFQTAAGHVFSIKTSSQGFSNQRSVRLSVHALIASLIFSILLKSSAPIYERLKQEFPSNFLMKRV